jgi:thioredoxin 1
MVTKINESNFEELVLNSDKLVMVDFWAEWCGPCRVLGPIIETLGEKNKDNEVLIAKLNVDEAQTIAVDYGVRGIPCVLFFKDGKEIEGQRKVGVNSETTYQKQIDSLI